MPFYRVLIEGKNLNVPGQHGTRAIVGFFTTRVVRATTSEEAERKAISAVRSEWQKPKFKNQLGGRSLDLAVSEVGESSFLRWLKAPNRGHTFFSDASHGEA